VSSDPPTKRKKPGESDLPASPEDRPTVVPPFDVDAFAREHAPPSIPKPTKPPRPTPGRRRSQQDVTIDIEDDPKDTPTVIPTKPPAMAASPDTDVSALVAPPADRFRAEAPTFTNELELEQARKLSELSLSSAPPPPRASTMPVPEGLTAPVGPMTQPPNSMTGRVSALSLADMRMPTPPPPALQRGAESEHPAAVTGDRPAGSRPRPLESSEPPPASQVDPVVDMRDRFSLGDYSGALAVAEMILVKEPSSVEAAKMAEECQRVLIKMYAARIGPLDRVPMVMVQPHELRWLSIDHRAGFLLSLVDGMSSIEMILDVSGMPLLDTLRILHELHQQRVISFRT